MKSHKFFLTWILCAGMAGVVPAAAFSEDVRIRVEYREPSNSQQNYLQTVSQPLSRSETLTVPDGQEKRFLVSTHTDYAAWFHDHLLEKRLLEDNAEFILCENYLVVRADRVGDEVDLTLTPEIFYRTQKGEGTILLKDLEQKVMIFPGKSHTVGDGQIKTEFESYFYRVETGDIVEIILTPLLPLAGSS